MLKSLVAVLLCFASCEAPRFHPNPDVTLGFGAGQIDADGKRERDTDYDTQRAWVELTFRGNNVQRFTRDWESRELAPFVHLHQYGDALALVQREMLPQGVTLADLMEAWNDQVPPTPDEHDHGHEHGDREGVEGDRPGGLGGGDPQAWWYVLGASVMTAIAGWVRMGMPGAPWRRRARPDDDDDDDG